MAPTSFGVSAGAHTLNGYLVRADHSQIAGSEATPVTFTTFVPTPHRRR